MVISFYPNFGWGFVFLLIIKVLMIIKNKKAVETYYFIKNNTLY